MTVPETAKLLILVAGAWFRQPSDRATVMVWAEVLAEVEAQDAMAAVRELIRTDREEPPPPGVVYRMALGIHRRREAERRRSMRPLEQPARTPEEIQQARKLVSEFTERLGSKTGRTIVH